jgi:hypothetical protein
VTAIPKFSVVAEAADDTDQPSTVRTSALITGSGEWGLLLIPVLISLAMIITMGIIGT